VELRMVAGLPQIPISRDAVPASIPGSEARSSARVTLMVPLRAERGAATFRARGIMAAAARVVQCNPRHPPAWPRAGQCASKVPAW
jgi:hypothetical protein